MASEDSVRWGEGRKPRRSFGANNCVEIAHAPGLVGVWDTKHRAAGPVVVGCRAWAAFLNTVK
ncbi:hypothetical protein GCM10022243_44290 [Saccharothrix violaceirubra]|uniref:DUF397 domain-containing protein n=1 Tax=Saccharothrix violaceirubra TaxID=413306 RepID=A0A7W7WV89_9PSEU|nr:DUF397 domain-containing protein [Saccharothrix violaceirubra]MBB4964682.1 hypothetical protein [Saccharothrix violaceirubra]